MQGSGWRVNAATDFDSVPGIDALASLLPTAESVPVAAIPRFIGELRRLEAELFARLVQPVATTIPADGEQLLDARAVADLMSLPETYVRGLGRQRALPTVSIGKYVRFRRADVLDYIAKHRDPLDGVMIRNVSSASHDGRRGTPSPRTARRNTGAARRDARRRAEQCRALGARGDGNPAVGGEAPPAPLNPSESEEG